MEALALRVLRNEPDRFKELLSRQGAVLLNRKGKPFALAVDVTGASLKKTLRLVTQILAQLAVSEMRAQARARGLSRMTPAGVDKAVRSYRAGRKR